VPHKGLAEHEHHEHEMSFGFAFLYSGVEHLVLHSRRTLGLVYRLGKVEPIGLLKEEHAVSGYRSQVGEKIAEANLMTRSQLRFPKVSSTVC
jgi:hypothetical protein